MTEPSKGPEPTGAELLALLDGLPDGWREAMGVRFVQASRDELVAELTIDARHLQPLGVVHGGVYAGLVETVASVGAGINSVPDDRYPVGLENHTSFLRAVRSGTLRATGRPLARGRRSHVWSVEITDDAGRLAATGTVRLMILERGSSLAGDGTELRSKEG